MKTFRTILLYIGASFVALIALLLAFLEIRSIFAGDFTLMNNRAASFFAYLFRDLFYLGLLAEAIILMIFKGKRIKIDLSLFIVSVGLFGGGILTFIYYHFIVALAVTVVALIPVIITAIEHFAIKEKDTVEE